MKKRLRFSFVGMISYYHPVCGVNVKWDGETDHRYWHSETPHKMIELDVTEDMTTEDLLFKAIKMNHLDEIEFLIFEDGRLAGNRIEDADGNPLSNEQIENYQLQMYLCDYSIYIEVLEITEPKTEELQKLFPTLKPY